MAKNDNLKDFLTDVANAIREKKGTTDLINPQDFSAEIASIETGGGGGGGADDAKIAELMRIIEENERITAQAIVDLNNRIKILEMSL